MFSETLSLSNKPYNLRNLYLKVFGNFMSKRPSESNLLNTTVDINYRPIERNRPVPGIRDIFACEILNPGFWNPEYSSRNPDSH